MDKSKKKRENPFADYLWQTEELLWMGRPIWQKWQYYEDLPKPELFSKISGRVNLLIFSVTFMAMSLMFTGKVADNQGLFYSNLILLILMPFFAILMRRFVSFFYEEEANFYAITNRRILVLIDNRFSEMQHELILVAGIKQMNHYQTLIWDEGQVGFFPDFVGVEDAEYLVHLVEQARGENIPIVQKTWRDTIIYDQY